MTDTAPLLEHIRQLEHDLAECREALYTARILNPGQPEGMVTLTTWAKSAGISRARVYQLRALPGFPEPLLSRGGLVYYGLESLVWWRAKRLERFAPKERTES